VGNEGGPVGYEVECRVLSYEAMVPIAVPKVLRLLGAYAYGTKLPDEVPNGAAVLPDEMGYGG